MFVEWPVVDFVVDVYDMSFMSLIIARNVINLVISNIVEFFYKWVMSLMFFIRLLLRSRNCQQCRLGQCYLRFGLSRPSLMLIFFVIIFNIREQRKFNARNSWSVGNRISLKIFRCPSLMNGR